MNEALENFKRTKAFLVCVDSDGCAMDTMDVKHHKCFGPKLVETWGLGEFRERILKLWFEVNLYSRTRGINRFKGMVQTFETLAAEGIVVPSLDAMRNWVANAPELSNPALKREAERTGDPGLAKALAWSMAVNKAISELPQDDKPFEHVGEGLAAAAKIADIAVVSSANGQAIQAEWNRHKLAQYTQALLGQEAGSKAACIRVLKQGRYEPDHVLMVGDALGDLKAAQDNGVLFYPILVGQEGFSWERLASEALEKLIHGSYTGAYQEKLIQEQAKILK